MKEWKEYKATDFCTNVTDGTHDSPKPKAEGHYLITSKHLQNNVIDFSSAYRISEEDYMKVIQRSRVEQFDILFSMIGTIGNTVRVVSPEVDFAVKNMAIFKMGQNDLKSKWLYYWLKSSTAKAYISSRLAGSTQSYLTLDALRNFPIYAPDERAMQGITDILSSIDDKIELNNRINHNLEEQAKALYKSWFVDYVPFKDGRFVESEMGIIPEGWHVGTLSELVEVRYGKDHKKLKTGLIPVYGSGGLMRYVEQALYEKESVLIPRKGTLNNVMYVNHPFWTVDTMFYTVGKIEHAIKYTHLYLLTQDLASMNAGSAVPSMTTDILNKLIVLIPSKTVLNDFDMILSALYNGIEKRHIECTCLSSTRDALIARLLSGEVEIDKMTC